MHILKILQTPRMHMKYWTQCNMTQFDVITFGSATVDIFVNTENKLFQKKHKGCISVPFGAKIAVNNLHTATGGGGTNTAACLRRLGLKTAYCGAIGNDIYAQQILEDLKRFKVSTALVKKTKGDSACSVIIDSSGHERTILTHKGAADAFCPSEVTTSMLSKGKHFYLCSLMKRSFPILQKVITYAHNNNKPVALNPSQYLIKVHKTEIRNMLPKVDYLIFNKQEAQLLAGAQHQLSIKQLLKKIHDLGPQVVIITDGKKGVYAYDGSYHDQKTRNVRVVETTGAGDAFGSACFAGFIKGKTIKQSLRAGVKQAENVIQHFGAKESLLTWNTLT